MTIASGILLSHQNSFFRPDFLASFPGITRSPQTLEPFEISPPNNSSETEVEKRKLDIHYRVTGNSLPSYFDILTKETRGLNLPLDVENLSLENVAELEAKHPKLIKVESQKPITSLYDFAIPRPVGYELVGVRGYSDKARRQSPDLELYAQEYDSLLLKGGLVFRGETSMRKAEKGTYFDAYFLPKDSTQSFHYTRLNGRRIFYNGMTLDSIWSDDVRGNEAEIKKRIELTPSRLPRAIASLREAGFVHLADRLESYPSLNLFDLERAFQEEAHYSYVSESKNTGFSKGEIANNPFSEFQKFSHDGRACYQCDGADALFRRFLEETLLPDMPDLFKLESITTYRNDGSGNLSAGNLHARTLLYYGKDSYHLSFDTTPSQLDPRNSEPQRGMVTEFLDRLIPEGQLPEPQDRTPRSEELNKLAIRSRSGTEEIEEVLNQFEEPAPKLETPQPTEKIQSQAPLIISEDKIPIWLDRLSLQRKNAFENYFVQQIPDAHWSKGAPVRSPQLVKHLSDHFSGKLSLEGLRRILIDRSFMLETDPLTNTEDLILVVNKFVQKEREKLLKWQALGSAANAADKFKPFANPALVGVFLDLLKALEEAPTATAEETSATVQSAADAATMGICKRLMRAVPMTNSSLASSRTKSGS
jgi:hypothetical protein